ncbi:hypothetical protein K493DRAFT_316292 [Basidiobolus meristosporus CBS 931.73]|uniref:Phosphatase phospho-type n=1 Tax=Basidiobolus meristosporus CBS 931.73 TaxID=1314790 RepID=A0A1Y1Y4F3_9FUNG|nr:hypothetical protein K493DRAFT_316292 [Basidiobolus meristosporus CBS 931.73]|eukprot:ORX92911.1 hypothetical protein K493DRAFT_316292 [Basidiobolus meristosporus CBS 931.73]
MTTKTLVAYDFDWSLIDEDSDNYLVSQLSPLLAQKMSELELKMQWTDMMNQLLGELSASGFTQEHMDKAWSRIPFSKDMIKALHVAKEANADIMIISDANTVAISKVLHHYQVSQLFANIITNPAQWREGKLVIDRLVPKETPHGCCTSAEGFGHTCSVNMCKGREITRVMLEGGYDRVIYVGDGANDFCPITKLRANDIALVRRGRVLSKIIETPSTRAQIHSNVIIWSEAADILAMYRNLFRSSPEILERPAALTTSKEAVSLSGN